jgi:hypothetical protein
MLDLAWLCLTDRQPWGYAVVIVRRLSQSVNAMRSLELNVPVVDKVTKTGASAHQEPHPDGSQIVDIKNIRVAIYPNTKGKSWLAQGFEIDYIAQGKSIRDVKKAFESGLAATIHQHLKIHGDIDKLLKPAPIQIRLRVLDRVFGNPGAIHATYSQLSAHNVPIVNIEYLALPAAA